MVDLIGFTFIAGGTCFAFMASLAVIVGIAMAISGGTWRKLRSRSRPLLWAFGLDWPEIKRTYKRAFHLYYARRLPESVRPGSPSRPSADDSLDESGDVSPGVFLPSSDLIEPPSENMSSSG